MQGKRLSLSGLAFDFEQRCSAILQTASSGRKKGRNKRTIVQKQMMLFPFIIFINHLTAFKSTVSVSAVTNANSFTEWLAEINSNNHVWFNGNQLCFVSSHPSPSIPGRPSLLAWTWTATWRQSYAKETWWLNKMNKHLLPNGAGGLRDACDL